MTLTSISLPYTEKLVFRNRNRIGSSPFLQFGEIGIVSRSLRPISQTDLCDIAFVVLFSDCALPCCLQQRSLLFSLMRRRYSSQLTPWPVKRVRGIAQFQRSRNSIKVVPPRVTSLGKKNSRSNATGIEEGQLSRGSGSRGMLFKLIPGNSILI